MGYTKIDDRFFDDFARTLKPFTIIVFMFLFRASNKNAESWYTFSTIAFKMGISLRSVKNAIKELKVKRMYEELGYRVQLAPMPTRWSLQNDLMGLWDLVAVNHQETIWAQIKMNKSSTYGKKLDAHRAWVVPPNTRKLLILWEPHQRHPEISKL